MKKFVKIVSGMSPCIWGIVEKWLIDKGQSYSFLKSWGQDPSPILEFENNHDFLEFYETLRRDVESGRIITKAEWLFINNPGIVAKKPEVSWRDEEFQSVCRFLDEEQVSDASKERIQQGFSRIESQSRGYFESSMQEEMAQNASMISV